MSEKVENPKEEGHEDDFIIDRNPVPLAFCAHPTPKIDKNAEKPAENDVISEIMEMIDPIQVENPGAVRKAESLKSYGCDTESEFEFSGGEDSDFEDLREIRAGALDSDEEFDRLVHFSAKVIEKQHKAEYPDENEGKKTRKAGKSQKTPNVREYDDLPPLESLSIECKSSLIEFGFVSKVVDCMVVIESTSTVVLDFDSYLFDQKGQAIGQIYDIFGQVKEPKYAIRFNSSEEANLLPIQMKVYYAPNEEEYSKTPFKGLNLAAANRETLQSLNRRLDQQEAVAKASDGQMNPDVGSDVEFSDDEAEKAFRKTRNAAKHSSDSGYSGNSGNRGGRKRDRRGGQRNVRFGGDSEVPRHQNSHQNPWNPSGASGALSRHQNMWTTGPPPPKPYNRSLDVEMTSSGDSSVPPTTSSNLTSSGPTSSEGSSNPYAEFGCYSGFNGRFGI